MAEQEEVKEKKGQKSSISLDELQAVVNAAVTAALQQTNASGKDIAEALLEARKPYVDPRQKLNEESMRKSMREGAKHQKQLQEAEQNACQHVKGSSPLSSRSDPFDSSLAKMVLDSGETIGICTNCTKVFSSNFPEDIPWLQKKSTNQTAFAGRRMFENPVKAMRARLGEDQKEIFVEEDKPEEVAAK